MTESQVGRPVSRVDGVAKVTGEARYAVDAEVRGMAHAVLVMSTVARGGITAIDTTGATAAPGVLGVFTHRNLARLALPSPAVAFLKRFLPVQDDQVRHAGQPVAIVVADTLERAQQASGLVGVTYQAEPPRVVLADDLGEAYVPPETNDGDNDYVRGDVAAGLATAHAVAEATYTTPMQHHNALEPSVTVAAWDGDRLTVHESTQSISNTQNALMQAFGLPRATAPRGSGRARRTSGPARTR